MSVKMRQEVERKIVRQFVKDTLAAGYRLTVSLDRGWDVSGDGALENSYSLSEIMKKAFAGDEAHLFILAKGEPPVEDGAVNSVGWVFLVFGNDGWDVISDYSDNALTNSLLARANKISKHYES